MKLSLLAAALLGLFPHWATAQVAILHIQVIEGEGAVNTPGSRNPRPLAVEVTDETGKPVEGASVSFHLPEEGPGGTFGNGLRTDVSLTDLHGRATPHTLQLNRISGRFQLRIVASKEQARAGTVSFQYIGGTATAPTSRSTPTASRGLLKWVALAVLAGGAATAGAIVAGRSGSPTASAAPPVTISIGTPTITVGKP